MILEIYFLDNFNSLQIDISEKNFIFIYFFV